MANEIFSVKRGIKERLESIDGLRAITFEPVDWSDFPVAIIRTGRRSAPRVGLNGSYTEADFVATVMTGGSQRDAYDALDSYIAASGEMSVEAAIDEDRTLGGAAESARLSRVENIRTEKMGGRRYAAADFRIRVEKRRGGAVVLELRDGSEVVSLLGAPYFADDEAIFAPAERDSGGEFIPRPVEIALWMRDAAGERIRDGLSALEAICARAERGRVGLWRGYGGSAIEYRVLRGRVERASDSGGGGRGLATKLSLSVEALGRLPTVEVSDTLYNESNGGRRNYIEISGVPGARGGLAQIRVHDPSGTWSNAQTMWIGVRSGERNADNLFFQGEDGDIERGDSVFEGISGVWSGRALTSSEASGDRQAQMEWGKAGKYTTRSEFTLSGHVSVKIAARDIPRGRFRALARVRTDTDNATLRVGHLGFGLGWSFGSESKAPNEEDVVFPSVASKFRTLDLGELTLPPTPIPDGFPTSELSLDIYGAFLGGGARNNRGTHHFRWSVDCVILMPIDEGEVIVSGAKTSERILLDVSSESGVRAYAMDESDTILGVRKVEEEPFAVGPEDARIYVARDDESAPSGVKFEVRASLTPLAAGL